MLIIPILSNDQHLQYSFIASKSFLLQWNKVKEGFSYPLDEPNVVFIARPIGPVH